MKLAGALSVLTAALIYGSASASTVTFEGVGDGCSVNGFYNGNTDMCGNKGNNNFGIQFGSNEIGLVSNLDGGGGNFGNQQQYGISGDTALLLYNGSGNVISTTINVNAGFTDSFSFFYSSLAQFSVDVLDSNGKSLIGGAQSFGDNNKNGSCGQYNVDYCVWTLGTLTFASGQATSVTIRGSSAQTYVDNLSFGSGGGGVPEPGSFALVGLALFGAIYCGRRRRNAP